MANPFADVFDALKGFVVKLFADASKVKTVIAAGVADAPKTAAAGEALWTATLPVVAALTVAIDDKGINIPADTTAYNDIKAWLPAFKAFSAVVESDYKDLVTKQVIAANTAPVVAAPPAIAPSAVVGVAEVKP